MKGHGLQGSLIFILVLSAVVCSTEEEALIIYDQIQVGDLSLNFSRGQDAMYIYTGETLQLNITINSELAPGQIVVKSSNERIFSVEEMLPIEVTFQTEFPLVISVYISGTFVGIEKLQGFYYREGGETPVQIFNYAIKVNRQPVFTQSVMQYVLMVWMIISYVTMGAKSDLTIIKEKLTRPWAVLIGMVCQFFIMPSLAFGLAHLFKVDDSTAVGLVIYGSCPGGWLSNAFSVLLDLDFVLSLTMTFCSTFLALGMMPLNLFLYTRSFTTDNDKLKIPYVELVGQLFLLIIPVGVGLLAVIKFPKFREICDKILKPVATTLVAIGLAVVLPFDYYYFLSDANIYGTAVLLPVVGGILGLMFAKLACLENRAAMTVAIETGSQNSLLALTMVKLFYPLPEADLVGRIPLLVVIFTLMEGVSVTCAYLAYTHLYLNFIKQGDTTAIGLKKVVTTEDKVSNLNASASVSKAVQTEEGIENTSFQIDDENANMNAAII